jgi:hypothetical protein
MNKIKRMTKIKLALLSALLINTPLFSLPTLANEHGEHATKNH